MSPQGRAYTRVLKSEKVSPPIPVVGGGGWGVGGAWIQMTGARGHGSCSRGKIVRTPEWETYADIL